MIAGIHSGIITPGFLGWCEMDFVHQWVPLSSWSKGRYVCVCVGLLRVSFSGSMKGRIFGVQILNWTHTHIRPTLNYPSLFLGGHETTNFRWSDTVLAKG